MIYERIAHLLPQRLRNAWQHRMTCGGCHIPPDRALGFVAFASVMVGLGVTFNTPLQGVYAVPVFVAAAGAMAVLFIAMLRIRAERRAAMIEDVLPDALQLVSANLKAGMTLDKALLASGQHKLGVLQQELARIATEVGFGTDMAEALRGLSRNVRSEKLATAVRLMLSGLRSGGEISLLLDATAKNLRHQEIVERKIRSAVTTYISFIVLALALVAPLLFALSTFLVTLLQQTTGHIVSEGPAGLAAAGMLSTSFLAGFSVLMLLTAAVTGSLLIGSIMKGKAVFGIRYIVPLGCSVLAVFFLVRHVLEATVRTVLG